MKKKNKEPGRPAGSANKKSQFVRDQVCVQFRCSQGYNKVVDEIMAKGNYKSKADIYHRALEVLAARELPATFFWINKIQ
jgi:hypothetical protein